MPDYTLLNKRLTSYNLAARVLPKLQQIYRQCQEVDDLITLYLAETDLDFNTAIDAVFTAPERAQLGAMLTDAQQLVAEWEAQHGTLLAFKTEEG